MIIRARVVVTMDGPPIENGAVAIEGNRIVDVGSFEDVKAPRADEVFDLGEQTLLPGLINAHCHLDYTCLRGEIPPQKSFTDWIRAINRAKAQLAPSDYLRSIADGFAEAQRFGTASIVNLEAFPELIARIPAPLRTWWLPEIIDVRNPSRPEELVDLAMGAMSAVENRGLAPHAPFTASLELYRLCQETARRHEIILSTHLSESREEFSMFGAASGPLYEFMKEIGRDMRDCGQETPLAYLMRNIALDERWLIAHLNQLSDEDFDLLARSRTKFHVVHSPRSHRFFGHPPFACQRLRSLGYNICLGTDSLASNDDLSLFAEMREVQRNERALSPEEILEMVTVNSARALERQSPLGRLKKGFHADMIALPSDAKGDLFDEVVAFDKEVVWAMIDGRVRDE